jgi:curved DNA-binding protein CbpA
VPPTRTKILEEPMGEPDFTDHYEMLQVSARADQDTIQRVFRHLAKRLHPDNADSGDSVRFKQLVESFEVLSDPERRARYDVIYSRRLEQTWRVFDQSTALDDVAADRRMRSALLSILYTARRNDADRPGLGEMDLERLLGCPETHLRFHVWYLKENGLIKRTESGALAITSTGVDAVLETGGPAQPGVHLLESGEKRSA